MENADVPAVPSVGFKNRRGLLIAGGVVQILIGCFLLFTAAVMAVVDLPATKDAANPMSMPGMRLILVCIYAIPALIFVTLGIGSGLAKNWARIGTLIVSWIWLAFGILQLVLVIFIIPAIFGSMPKQPNQPEGFAQLVTIITVVFVGAFGIVLPAIFLAIYHSKHVRATCVSGSSSVGRRQTPVLLWILSIWLGFGALGSIGVLFTPYPAVIFGVLLSGVAGRVIYVLTALVYGWAAWGLFQRKLVAWRVSFWLNVLWIASALVTFTSRDIVQLYREMGMSAQELAILERLPISSNFFVLLCLLPAIILIGLLYYSKRYMGKPNPSLAS